MHIDFDDVISQMARFIEVIDDQEHAIAPIVNSYISSIEKKIKPDVTSDEDLALLTQLAAASAAYTCILTQCNYRYNTISSGLALNVDNKAYPLSLKKYLDQVTFLAKDLLIDSEFIFEAM